MTMKRRLLIVFFALPSIAHTAPPPLREGMTFTAARKLLLKEKWKPINVHAYDDYALMGVEHELAKMNIREFDAESCNFRAEINALP
jgi:hypothetical protein